MGIFARLRSSGPAANDGTGSAGAAEQEALRLIDEGNAFQVANRIDEAEKRYLDALRLAPNLARAHLNHGNILLAKGFLEDALAAFRTAIRLKPDYAGAYYNIGNALLRNRRYEEAISSYRRALEVNPDYAEAYSNLGMAQQALRRNEDAAMSYRRALRLKPGLTATHNNLGNALKDLGQIQAAVASYRRALELKPDFAEAHNNLGVSLKEQGKLDEAERSYRRALELKPDFVDAYSNFLFALNYAPGRSPTSYLDLARQYGQLVTRRAGRRFLSWQCAVLPERLRVGLVSGDLRTHSVGHFLEGLLSHIDPARIELVAYQTYHVEDELTARIRPYFSAWQPLCGMSDEDAAQLIHDSGVHILLDISGHTAHNRLPLFAWKPAPVQVTWLGLPNTSGVTEMDYVLGDHMALPPEHVSHFSESVWRLPDSYVCFTAPSYAVEVAALPALLNGYVTFGSFNHLTKINDEVVELWARILRSVPRSRLYLKTEQLEDTEIRRQTMQRFADRGIVQERLLLSGIKDSVAAHLSEYNSMDIALDTFPYPGVTTSAEALWMGVPVVSLHGDCFLSLSAKSIACHVGLPDWVAMNKDDYVAKAVAFASDLEGLSELRQCLRQQVLASPLFDTRRFARNFEKALYGMWQDYQDRQQHMGSGTQTKPVNCCK